MITKLFSVLALIAAAACSEAPRHTYYRLVSVPLPSFSTRIVAASVKEDKLNSAELFFPFVESNRK